MEGSKEAYPQKTAANVRKRDARKKPLTSTEEGMYELVKTLRKECQ